MGDDMEYVFTFLEGIASFVSPCFLPMIPIYVAYFAGSEEEKKSKTLCNAFAFIIGFSLVFMMMSLFASSFGMLFSRYVQCMKTIFGIIMIILGLNYMELIKIKFLNYSKGIKMDTQQLNFLKAFLFGVLFAFCYTPCIGVFLGSALLLIAKNQQLLKGVVLILCYCLGLRWIAICDNYFYGTFKDYVCMDKKTL